MDITRRADAPEPTESSEPSEPGEPGETIEVIVGRIGRPHGLRGEVSVDVRTDEPDERYALGAVLRVSAPEGSHFGPSALTVSGTRWHGGTLLVRFAELADRTAAEGARGVVLVTDVDASRRSEDPDEFYDHQLVGLTVYDEHGALLGTVAAVLHGAQDLLGVATVDGREALVPFVKALVPEVDVAAGRVVVADRPGLVTPLDS